MGFFFNYENLKNEDEANLIKKIKEIKDENECIEEMDEIEKHVGEIKDKVDNFNGNGNKNYEKDLKEQLEKLINIYNGLIDKYNELIEKMYNYNNISK